MPKRLSLARKKTESFPVIYVSFIKLKGMEVNHFAILDDHANDYSEMKLSKHLVKTSFIKGGLTKRKAEKPSLCFAINGILYPNSLQNTTQSIS